VETSKENSIQKEKKPELEYPREWGFKIIGKDKEALEGAIKDVLGQKEHTSSFGNYSKNGKFCSYNASCQVENKEERDKLFKAFQDHKDVKMVI
jgi:putative lipoic acid-binding regulatory protein